jgi:hypothetical protein
MLKYDTRAGTVIVSAAPIVVLAGPGGHPGPSTRNLAASYASATHTVLVDPAPLAAALPAVLADLHRTP